MCELIKKLTISESIDLIQMIIAFFSALLLYLTFRKQGENDKRNLELFNIEKSAKTAEYFPELNVSVIKEFPIKDSPDGNSIVDLTIDKNSIYTLELSTKKNSLKYKSIKILKNDYQDNFIIDDLPEDLESQIYSSGIIIKFNIRINYNNILKKNGIDIPYYWIIKNQGVLNDVVIYVLLIFEDLLGNIYEQKVKIFEIQKHLLEPAIKRASN